MSIYLYKYYLFIVTKIVIRQSKCVLIEENRLGIFIQNIFK